MGDNEGFKTSVEEVTADVILIERELEVEVEPEDETELVIYFMIKLEQMRTCFSWMSKESRFLRWMKVCPKNLEYYINLVDTLAAEFEKIDSNF